MGGANGYSAKPTQAPTLSDRILTMFDRGASLTTAQVSERLGRQQSSVCSVLRALADAGKIDSVPTGVRGTYMWRKAGK